MVSRPRLPSWVADSFLAVLPYEKGDAWAASVLAEHGAVAELRFWDQPLDTVVYLDLRRSDDVADVVEHAADLDRLAILCDTRERVERIVGALPAWVRARPCLDTRSIRLLFATKNRHLTANPGGGHRIARLLDVVGDCVRTFDRVEAGTST